MSAFEDFFPAVVGGAEPLLYIPGSLHLSSPYGVESTIQSVPDADHLTPFIPRADITIDAVVWRRHATTAADVYVGLFDSAGNLLTDCSVDSATTVGFHAVSSTPVELLANRLYYVAINQTVAVLSTHRLANTPEAQLAWLARYGILAELGANDPGTVRKTRTAAAFPSSIGLTGYTNLSSNAAIVAGVRVSS